MTLPYGLTPELLAAAEAEPDPESLAASTRLRRSWPPDLVAAAVTQVVLRRKAATKFGTAAASMFFTRDGLEQATRPAVAAHHAQRFVAAGARRVVDLGCGIGTDAYAFAAAGLEVVAVERDPATAEVARANLPETVQVVVADAESVLDRAGPDDAVFVDPARRTGAGRSWRVEDLTPSWDFVAQLFDRAGPTGVKLGPGFPRTMIPDVDAEWVDDGGDLVELGLWSGPSRRSAYATSGERVVVDPLVPEPGIGDPQAWLHVPSGAVTRSGALAVLASDLGATRLHPDVTYLTGAAPADTAFATSYAVLDQFAFRERDLKAWVKRHDVGRLEILTRGLDLDPAVLRRRLSPHGAHAATVVITRTTAGKSVLVVRPRFRPLDSARARDTP